MELGAKIDADTGRPGLTSPAFELCAAAIVFCAYTATLGIARDLALSEAAVAGVMNTVPVIAFGAPAQRIIVGRFVGRSVPVQIVGHTLLGAGFSLLAYWLLMVLLGLMHGVSATEFAVRPFPSRVMAWQLLENLTIYGVVAALAYLRVQPNPVSVILSTAEGAREDRAELSRYFLRRGDDILPVDVSRIVSIAGADDYAEVTTLEGTHLVRMTLSEFEKALDARKFIRVHRSRIVNVERIARAEPAGGGRILLHMENGEMIPASRTGSKLLRDRVL